jgi:hypothetical protein
MPVIAFCCQAYGWELEACLKLPLKTLFAFHREGQRLEAIKNRELLRIHAVSIMNLDYYYYWREYYTGIIDPTTKELPPKPEMPNQTPGLDLSSQETKNKIIAMFSHGKKRT